MHGRSISWFSGVLSFGALMSLSALYLGLSWRLSVVSAFCGYLGLYMFRAFEPERLSSFRSSLISSCIGVALGLAVFWIFHPIWQRDLTEMDLLRFYPLGVIAVLVLNLLLFFSYRALAPVRRYLVVGRREEFDHLLDEIKRRSFGKLEFIGLLNPSFESLDSLVKGSDGLLIADPDQERYIEGRLRELEGEGYSVERICDVAERVLGRIPVEVAERFRDYYEPFFREARDGRAKRVLDVVVSVIALLVFSPVMLLIALAILFETGRPVIFRQRRIGKGGKPFTMYKFRSLRVGPVDPNNPNSVIEERVTFVGGIIRKVRLDELPQFWNVLRGDMSVVGPRPEMEEYHRMCEGSIPFYRYRLSYRPGISGWAQLNYKHTSDPDEYRVKTGYDLYYVKNRNILMDLGIIFKTPRVMLSLISAR